MFIITAPKFLSAWMIIYLLFLFISEIRSPWLGVMLERDGFAFTKYRTRLFFNFALKSARASSISLSASGGFYLLGKYSFRLKSFSDSSLYKKYAIRRTCVSRRSQSMLALSTGGLGFLMQNFSPRPMRGAIPLGITLSSQ